MIPDDPAALARQIARMMAWSETHPVPILLPFSDEVSLTAHRTIYQFNSPDTDKAKAFRVTLSSFVQPVKRPVVLL